ncbi:hypothetical protein P8610_11160 [Fictibacillus sp. UD]|uniref:hypothetical protein n=1 Tax=Fictibacillus sp. UD TaxID=3038777 RepID=UPI003746DBE1
MGDSCGTGGQVRHLKVKRTNVAHRLPRGKLTAWSGNQLLSKSNNVCENSILCTFALYYWMKLLYL